MTSHKATSSGKSSRKAAHDMTAAEKRAERDHRKSERAAGRTVEGAPDDDSDLEENTTGSVPTAIPADPSGGADATTAGEGAGTEVNDSGAVYEVSQAENLGKNVNATGTVAEHIPPQSTVPGAVTPGTTENSGALTDGDTDRASSHRGRRR
jgi:hypothetical protein